jgi:hypothetical protein
LLGNTLGPEQAFQFARGAEIVRNTGQRAQLNRPLGDVISEMKSILCNSFIMILKSDLTDC